MIGEGELFIQPSELDFTTGVATTAMQRGIPTPGVSAAIVTPAIAPVGGLPTCNNLIAASPPTLLEQYEIYSYSIGWSAVIVNGGGFASAPVVDVELALLVNDRVKHRATTQQETINRTAPNAYEAPGGFFNVDLVNPIRVGSRDRLGLRMGLGADLAFDSFYLVVGSQVAGTRSVPAESTILYRVYDLPGARTL